MSQRTFDEYPMEGRQHGDHSPPHDEQGDSSGSGGRRKIELYITTTPSSEKAICFVGGCALMVASLLEIINIPLIWHDFPRYIVYWYLFAFGALVAVLNGQWALPTQEVLLKYFYFMHCKDGKGFVCCFLGALVVVVDAWWPNYIAGFWLFCTGVMCWGLHIQETRNANQQELEVRGEVYEQM